MLNLRVPTELSFYAPTAATLTPIMESAQTSIHQLLASFDWISAVTHSHDLNALLHSNDPPSPLQSVDLEFSVQNMVIISRKFQEALDLLGNAVTSLEAHMSRV